MTNMGYTDLSIPDQEWWYSTFAEFEDFVGIGAERATALADYLLCVGERYQANRLLEANGLPHGPTNAVEDNGRSGHDNN